MNKPDKPTYKVGFLLTALPKFGQKMRTLYRVAKTPDSVLQGNRIDRLDQGAVPLEHPKPAWFQVGDVLVDPTVVLEITSVGWKSGYGVTLGVLAQKGVMLTDVSYDLPYLLKLPFSQVYKRRTLTLKELETASI